MDIEKCNALKRELAPQPEPQVVPIARFFDGNDDLGSIGCNLGDHPGMDVFRNTLTGLLKRPDVEAVYAQIYELDPDEDSWPFTDTVLVVGTVAPEVLEQILAPLMPDEVGSSDPALYSPSLTNQGRSSIAFAWWD